MSSCYFILILAEHEKKSFITRLSPPVIFYWPFQGGASFMDPFYYLCFMIVFIILACLFLKALLSPDGKGLTSCLSCVWCFPVFLSLSHMVYRVWCGVWLYRFVIFAFNFTFTTSLLVYYTLYHNHYSISEWPRCKSICSHITWSCILHDTAYV